MIGTALSRWTMSYFTVALVFLVGAQMLMVAGYGFPAVAAEAPETLVLVHMVTIGWLSMLMCGALFQFVPVLIAQPLRGERLVLPALICLLTGLAFLLAGFLQLAGVFDAGIPCSPWQARFCLPDFCSSPVCSAARSGTRTCSFPRVSLPWAWYAYSSRPSSARSSRCCFRAFFQHWL